MGNHHSKSASNESGDNNNHVCDQQEFALVQTSPIAGNFEFHQINMIVSGACAAFSTVMLFALMFQHAINFSKPQEQSTIMRICLFIPIYAIGSFIEVCAPASYVYLQPWLEVAQAFALANFFLLLCHLLSFETDTRRDVFLAPMKLMQEKTDASKANIVSNWRKIWLFVFQFPVVAILIAIFTDITQGAGKYCYGSHKAYFASLWLEIIEKLSIIVAIISVLKTYGQLKNELRPHRALPKLFAFKLLIGLQLLQQIIYMILTRISPSPLEPSATLSYTDLQVGIPVLLVSCEVAIFSVFFHFAYSVTPYRIPSRSNKALPNAEGIYYGGPLGVRAWASVVNPAEIVAAFKFALTMRREADASGLDSEQAMPLDPRSGHYRRDESP